MPNESRDEQFSPPTVQIYEQCPTHALASWDNVFVVVFRTDTTEQAVRALHRECAKFGRATSKGIFLVTVIEQGAPGPAPPERKALAQCLSDISSCVRGSAVIIEGHGFRSAMVRGVVTGLTMLAKQAYPHQVCSLVGAAELFQKVASSTGMVFRVDRFRAAMAEFRQTIAAESSPSKARLAG